MCDTLESVVVVETYIHFESVVAVLSLSKQPSQTFEKTHAEKCLLKTLLIFHFLGHIWSEISTKIEQAPPMVLIEIRNPSKMSNINVLPRHNDTFDACFATL